MEAIISWFIGVILVVLIATLFILLAHTSLPLLEQRLKQNLSVSITFAQLLLVLSIAIAIGIQNPSRVLSGFYIMRVVLLQILIGIGVLLYITKRLKTFIVPMPAIIKRNSLVIGHIVVSIWMLLNSWSAYQGVLTNIDALVLPWPLWVIMIVTSGVYFVDNAPYNTNRPGIEGKKRLQSWPHFWSSEPTSNM